MKIRNFAHKGLKRFYEGAGARGVPSAAAGKLADMLGFLDGIVAEDELHRVPMWKAHKLTGNRRGAWSLSVTPNWRMTFWIDGSEPAVCDLNLEDYH